MGKSGHFSNSTQTTGHIFSLGKVKVQKVLVINAELDLPTNRPNQRLTGPRVDSDNGGNFLVSFCSSRRKIG